jgi:hypothetical protein
MLWWCCSSSHTEHHKIRFAIFRSFLQIDIEFTSHWFKWEIWEESNSTQPLRTLNFDNYALAFNTQALGDNSPSQECPPTAGKLADSKVGPEEANKRGESAIGLTCGWITVVARTERRTAMAGGEAVAARPPRLGLRWNATETRPSSVIGGSRLG